MFVPCVARPLLSARTLREMCGALGRGCVWQFEVCLGNHVKRHVAAQHASGRSDGHVAGGRAGWDSGFDERIRYDRKVRGNPIQQDACCACESLAENAGDLVDFARTVNETHEWAEPHVEAEDNASTTGSPARSYPVELPVSGLQ